jgi:hypothetical protein
MFLLPSVVDNNNNNSRSHININTQLMTNNIINNNTAELLDGAVGWALGRGVELPVLSALRFLPTTVTTTVLALLFRRVVVFTVLQTALYLPVLPAQVLDFHLPFRICLKRR